MFISRFSFLLFMLKCGVKCSEFLLLWIMLMLCWCSYFLVELVLQYLNCGVSLYENSSLVFCILVIRLFSLVFSCFSLCMVLVLCLVMLVCICGVSCVRVVQVMFSVCGLLVMVLLQMFLWYSCVVCLVIVSIDSGYCVVLSVLEQVFMFGGLRFLKFGQLIIDSMLCVCRLVWIELSSSRLLCVWVSLWVMVQNVGGIEWFGLFLFIIGFRNIVLMNYWLCVVFLNILCRVVLL